MCSEVNSFSKWKIRNDTDGNISIESAYIESLWIGADIEIKGSGVPVPWRLIPAEGKCYVRLLPHTLLIDVWLQTHM